MVPAEAMPEPASPGDVLGEVLETTGFAVERGRLVGADRIRCHGPLWCAALRAEATVDGVPLPESGARLIMSARSMHAVASDGGALLVLRFRFARPMPHPFFDIPSVTDLDEDGATTAWPLAQRIASELRSDEPGASTVVAGLAPAIFVCHLREHARRTSTQEYPSPLRDRDVYRALQEIHADLRRDWTSDLVAERVGVSRATLYRRFTTAVGLSPAQYLGQWRLARAHVMLVAEGRTVTEVADLLGYKSPAAFSRAFKRHAGAPPSALVEEK
jgi:AraC-like DNA-binding protein